VNNLCLNRIIDFVFASQVITALVVFKGFVIVFFILIVLTQRNQHINLGLVGKAVTFNQLFHDLDFFGIEFKCFQIGQAPVGLSIGRIRLYTLAKSCQGFLMALCPAQGHPGLCPVWGQFHNSAQVPGCFFSLAISQQRQPQPLQRPGEFPVLLEYFFKPAFSFLRAPLLQADFTQQVNDIRILPGLRQYPPADQFRLLRITGAERFHRLVVLLLNWI
jgi:hypothetical protein